MMPACECQFPAHPVLADLNVRSVPVLGTQQSRLGLTSISRHLRWVLPKDSQSGLASTVTLLV
ncbi:MAG: hypothetical protein EOQ70_17920 [Mesorhizobium sp.]|nr:MAG: hypothetical protein EOQ70_17920 [Mesorhizobium sp.]RWK16816.1 MAG: hypothetical protein EOR41_19025 [Mesorhizobium sp.]TIQ47637.1 MAG: hypothetical protein E5X47_21560 [Mesorhizobium sp.]TIQ55667.1 MAG: hypothetical protein E5X46_22160 [Mesorhizobium sp.]